MGTEKNQRQPMDMGTLLRDGIEGYQKEHKLNAEQSKAVRGIISCRTKEMGGHVKTCNSCGFTKQSYNSCRNRHCPKCQYVKQEQWVDKLAHNLIPCKYFHLVFTIPCELRSIFLGNPRLGYSLLFKASAQALLKSAANPNYLGAQVGALAVLHTWTQTLSYHPHIHMLVPAGGLSEDSMEWKRTKKNFFLPQKVLSRIYRGIMISLLKNAVEKGELKLAGGIQEFEKLKKQLYEKDWNVHMEKPFAGVLGVLKYLGRYTHRVAISNNRIIRSTENKVTFRYKDNKDKGKQKEMTLETGEFIRRYLQHILPTNFYKIRYIGILACVNSKKKKGQCIALLGIQMYLSKLEGLTAMEVVEHIKGKDPLKCPQCAKGILTNKIRDSS